MSDTQFAFKHIGWKLLLLAAILGLLVTATQTARAQTETVLYSFLGGADGAVPDGGLARDTNGNLYGTTLDGGKSSQGTIFELSPSGVKTILHNFKGEPRDGSGPEGNLLLVGNTFYGATVIGGTLGGYCEDDYFDGCGAVYEMTSAGAESVIYSFAGGSDGLAPMSGVVVDQAGNMYGTTLYGGGTGCNSNEWGCGTLFKVTPAGEETVLHQFTGGADGMYPWGGLTIDENGYLYGTTEEGGTGCSPPGCGTVFEVAPDGTRTILHNFTGCPKDGDGPMGNLIRDSKGNLYGTTLGGGSSCKMGAGTVFKIAASGREKILYNFGGAPDGAEPWAGLVRDKKGNLYGTTFMGGLLGCQDGEITCGTVFEVSHNRTETVLYRFTGGADGGQPMNATLVLDAEGNLYGTTPAGGDPTCNCGVIFKVTP